jgi:hypothetical protein
MKSRETTPVHLQIGKENKLAIVFSCPGRFEEIAGHPAARTTGRNLEMLLSLLSKELNRTDLERSNVTITNAWPNVEYKEKTGRSEATLAEITAPENLKRLREELDQVTELVIFCGERARAAGRLLNLRRNPRFVYIGHLGLKGLCLIRTDVGGNPIVAIRDAASGKSKRDLQRQNTQRRLAVLARSIRVQLHTELSSKTFSD